PTQLAQSQEEQQYQQEQHQSKSQGHCPVFIAYETDDEMVELRLGEAVRAPVSDESIKALKKVLGEERVRLVY
ncbi:MAG: hypothetical protein V3V19_05880, partial [Cocleimonas sp.]